MCHYSFLLYKLDTLPDEFFEDLNDALDNINVFDLVDADFNFNGSNSKSVFNTIAFRYAISLKLNF